MKRRTLLAGIGTTVLGASYAFDTGAFGRTEAERQVSISTSSDADAYLRLTPGPGDTAGFVSQNGDGVVSVAIGQVDNSVGDPAQGANPGVVTAFKKLLRIGNYGTDPVAVSATLPTDGGVALMTAYDGPDAIDTLDEPGVELSLAPGESGVVGLAIDTGYGTDEIPGTIGDSGDVEITITAQAE